MERRCIIKGSALTRAAIHRKPDERRYSRKWRWELFADGLLTTENYARFKVRIVLPRSASIFFCSSIIE